MNEPTTTEQPLKVRRVGRCSPESRSHIVAAPAAPRTLCGVKVSGRSNGDGITWAAFVQAHIDGHDPLWCERCLYEWSKP
jgi:hypothetical protein